MLLARSLGSFSFEWPVMARAICNEARVLAITGYWLVPIGLFPLVVVRWVRWVVLWVVMAVKSMALMMAAGQMMSEGVGE
jgi:hypothetical protein